VATDNPTPLFVVGSPRSGTSALVAALRAAGYRGFNEGNFLGLLAHMRRITDNYFDTFWTDDPFVMMSRIDRDEFKSHLAELFKRIIGRENPVEPWLDKSGNPEVVMLIPVLRELWPSAHFIFAKRRGIENIASRVRKFPAYGFEYHCKDWAANMSAWRAVRQDLPDLPCIEVEQYGLVHNPAAAAAPITAFLRLSPKQEARLVNAFRKERPQQTEAGSTARVLTLKTAGWSPQQIELFKRHCGQEMELFGYSLDESYKVPVPA
jgi:hypothetical protein